MRFIKNKFLENPEKKWQNYRGSNAKSLKKDLIDIGELLEREKMRLKAMENLGILNTEDADDTGRSFGNQLDFQSKPNKDRAINWKGE